MPEALLVETLGRVRRHPWWHARAALAVAALKDNAILPPASILDVGCGWGTNLQALEEAGYRTVGLDVSRQILELIDRPARELIEADLNHLPPEAHDRYDGLLLLDVIEHLDDDRGALSRVVKLVRPGGLVVVSVPALPELFSEYDEIQGHRRRYLPESLRAACAGTGVTVRNIFWWGAWMVPVLRRMRRNSKSKGGPAAKTYADYLRLPPWPVPLVMKLLLAREKGPALKGRLRTGTSLFMIGTRRD
jgi:SAM-dependent methyltransferase